MSSNHHHHAAALLFLAAAAALPLARSSSLCLAHPSCPPVHATHCCPTATNKQLSCCDNGAPIRPLCAANPSCARLAPSPGDLCCPDADGIFAPCCPGAWVDGAPLLPLVQPKSALAEAVPLALPPPPPPPTIVGPPPPPLSVALSVAIAALAVAALALAVAVALVVRTNVALRHAPQSPNASEHATTPTRATTAFHSAHSAVLDT